MAQPLIVVLGPTASGKTKLAIALARHLNGEIISADSRQVFKGMDIGTGKDLKAYDDDGLAINHHLIDIINAGEKYHVNAFKEDFAEAFKKIVEKGKMPILCGGTGMYIHSILQNHQLTAVPKNEILREQLESLSKVQLIERLTQFPSKLRAFADFSSTKRLIRAIEIASYLVDNRLQEIKLPDFYPIVIGLKPDLLQRRRSIAERLKARLDQGLVEEVKQLIANGIRDETLLFYGLEYKFVTMYLNNELSYGTMIERLTTAIFQFAKRQMTFFRKMEKDGVVIHWFDVDRGFEQLTIDVMKLLEAKIELN